MAKKKSNKLIWILLAVIAILIAAVIFKRKNTPKGTKVTAEMAQKRTIRETVAASGKVFPVTEVKIASDVSGELVELYVEEGDSVTTGQLLAKVDPEALESQVERGLANVNSAQAQVANALSNVESAKAQKAQIEAQLVNAREQYNRSKNLVEDGVISQAEFEGAEANLRQLEANLAAAIASIQSAQETVRSAKYSVASSQASLDEIKTNLRRATIYATMDGIVSQLNVEEGERVVGTNMMSGTEILKIANLNAMEVQVEVSENDITSVAVGQSVDVEIDAYPDRTFKGIISQIANSASNMTSATGQISLTTDQVTNFVVKININQQSYQDLILPNKPFPFRPGMSASVEIYTNTANDVISVPIQAVTVREEAQLKAKKSKYRSSKSKNRSELDKDDLVEIVFLVKGDTTAIQRVKTGIQDDDFIQILEGLTTEDQVITAPYSAISKELEVGSEIRVVEEDKLYEEE